MLSPLSRLSDEDLMARLPAARAAERKATAQMIGCLAEVDRRRLYLAQACSSLQAFCLQRLGYSENEAQKRIQVARLCQRLPQVLAELENGSVHLTGLFLLSAHLTADNASALLAESRGRTRREIEAVIARWFPRSDVLPSITAVMSPASGLAPGIPENAMAGSSATAQVAPVASSAAQRLEPLSAASYRVEFTAGKALRDKIEQARNLLGHAVPSGNLAELFERALDALLSTELKRRLGAGKPRRQRSLKLGSRHVPVEVARAVWERDGAQCTFVDGQGRRCGERRFITIEHREPFARGGAATTENLCLLCAAHNALRAREEFGAEHIEAKQLDALEYDKTLSALIKLGFERRKAKAALETLRRRGARAKVEALLRGALAVLVT
jgi:hypothetical protein